MDCGFGIGFDSVFGFELRCDIQAWIAELGMSAS